MDDYYEFKHAIEKWHLYWSFNYVSITKVLIYTLGVIL